MALMASTDMVSSIDVRIHQWQILHQRYRRQLVGML